ncbi:MAG: XRE family transcriptional regulator [Gemmatimonadaceae bacterium]
MSFDIEVRARRRHLGLSLQQLSARSGVSTAMLSEVERGRKSPTLRVAAQIAEGLECAVSELLEAPPSTPVVVRRRAERRALVDDTSGIERQLLAPALLSHGIEVVWYVVPAGGASGVFSPQRGGVLGHVTVVRGALDCVAGTERIHLHTGDSIDYPGDIDHEFHNPGARACEFVLVVDASHAGRLSNGASSKAKTKSVKRR